MAKAHSMVVQLLRLPTLDNVMGLLILSWAEFGQVSEPVPLVGACSPARRIRNLASG
jgi:hypothetical protein